MPISRDLRERMVKTVDESPSEVARRFDVSASFVRKLRVPHARTGCIEARTAPGPERGVQPENESALRRCVAGAPDATLNELQATFGQRTGIHVSETTMWRTLRRMGYTLKKMQLRAAEQDRPDVKLARKRFKRWLRRCPVERLIFVDESGVNLALTRQNARAPKGERAVDSVPGGRWQTFSVVAALRVTDVQAPMVIPGAMNTISLRTWVKECLCPGLRPQDIVVWDNLQIHGDVEVVEAIRQRGARVKFLPEFNPIEEAWSKMKALLRAVKAGSLDALVNHIGAALQAIAASDCDGWFSHAGWRLR